MPVDFEADSWWDELAAAGFDPDQPAVVASTGVSKYLTKEANAPTARAPRRAGPPRAPDGREGRPGFRSAEHVPLSELAERYFSGRTDGFRPSTGEDLVVATT